MKLNATLEEAFNKRITLEFSASMVYRQLAIEMDGRDFPGLAAWLRHQADQEIMHANKFINHLTDRGNHPIIGVIDAPEVNIDSVLGCFKAAAANEAGVSESIRELTRAAEKAGDLDSRPLLNWFITEQFKEEAAVGEILGRIHLIDNDGPGLLRLDEELGLRPTMSTESAGDLGPRARRRRVVAMAVE